MLYLILLFIIIALADTFIWWNFLKKKKSFLTVLFWLPLVIMVVSVILGLNGIYTYYTLRVFFVLMICFGFPSIVFAVISLVANLVGIFTKRTKLVRTSLIFGVVFVVIGCGIYGFTYGWKRFDVVEQVVKSPDIPPAFNNYRIVQLSDLHVGTFDHDPAVLDTLINIVNSLKADLIVFTGDLINVHHNEVDPYMEALSKMKATDGVISIMGNHDYAYYDKEADEDELNRRILALEQKERDMGWDLLLNENRVFERDGQYLAIVGVENDSKPPHPARGDLKAALVGIPEGAYVILLSHDPSHWRREVVPETNIPVTLSGHTHAMQFKIGNISPAQLIYDEWGGHFDEDEQMLYVNVGTGSNVPFRFGAWSEIGLITLVHED